MNKAKIVIIGAGASGIACATKLLEYGFKNVLIVEAEPRIGGRIHTISFADNVIDLGAQWCHGEKQNIVYDMVHNLDMLDSTGDIYENYECIRSNREILPTQIAQRLKNIVFESMVTRQVELCESNESLGSYLHKKFYDELKCEENKDIDKNVAGEFFENYKKFENSVEASDDLNEVSGRGYLEYWECEGDLLLNWKNKGYIEFLRLLMQSNDSTTSTALGSLEGKILFNKTVAQINWQRTDGMVQVVCAENQALLADHVIVTTSLGVLKEQHTRLFQPNLPADKRKAIEGLSFGTVNKLFLEFPTKFWPDKWTGFSLLWREEDLAELRQSSNAWLEDVFGFYCVSYQPRVLCAWIIGPHGRHMETLPESEVLEGCMYLLRKFLCWSIPQPVNFKYSNWYKQSNFRGSYSFRSMLTEELNTTASDLAQPLTMESHDKKILHSVRSDKPILQFAGEATSDHYYSTVHGAVEAGWREAKRLLDFYATAHL